MTYFICICLIPLFCFCSFHINKTAYTTQLAYKNKKGKKATPAVGQYLKENLGETFFTKRGVRLSKRKKKAKR